ncbi:DUF6783 domain-containing protein [Enterocloster hominis (ex Hitch et al. 2024)]|uniref:DUF6783 domain-containing protein n=1 Tax=Enterocloster hominis (ex Hitch et al. 2024) TaxID=1917870 RepID=UPI003B500A55
MCLKIHSRRLHAPLCGIFGPDSVSVARYASTIGTKSPTKWDAQPTESNFQTRSSSGLRRPGICARPYWYFNSFLIRCIPIIKGRRLIVCKK